MCSIPVPVSLHEQQILVALCLVMLSTHVWAVRSEAAAKMRKTWASLSKWMVEKRSSSKATSPEHDNFQDCWQALRIHTFQRITTLATHAAGLVLFVFLLCTDVASKISLGKLIEFPLCVIFAANYAALLLNFITLDSVSVRRMDVFYCGFLLTAVASMLYVETGPLFFILRGNDALAQGMLALVVMDVRRSALGGAIYAACCSASYIGNVFAFRDDFIVERDTQIFIFWQFALWVFTCTVAYAAEYLLKASLKATVENEDLQHALHRVLSGLCDAVLTLNTDMLIKSPTPKLLHMLVPNVVHDQSALQDKGFVAFLASKEDQMKFLEFISQSSLEGSDVMDRWRPAAAAHVQLRDARGDIFPVELFHTRLQGSTCPGHLIGIRHCGSKDDSCYDLTALANMASQPTDFSRSASQPPEPLALSSKRNVGPADAIQQIARDNMVRDHASSEVAPRDGLARERASSEAGRSRLRAAPSVETSNELWRCPRCRATRQDWGDLMSSVSGVSGEDGLESLHSRAIQPLAPSAAPPAAVGQLDQQTISSRFTALHQLAPDLCREVLSESMSTYNLLHEAAHSLEGEEESQYVQTLRAQVLGTLLIGSKLEPRWPGLGSTWHRVVTFITGALPVPLASNRRLHAICMSPSQHSLVVAWQLPIFTRTNISPNWWGLGPQGIYNRVRDAVLNRSAMLSRPASSLPQT